MSRWWTLRAIVSDFTFNPHAFVDAILALLKAYKVDVLIPVHDGSIEALRTCRADIERWTSIALAKESALQVAIDKSRTLDLASRLGLRVPRGVLVTDPSHLTAAMREIGYPAVVKPLRSWVRHDGTGNRLVCCAVINESEAARAAGRMITAGSPVVVQEWLPGRREAVSLFYAAGRIWARFAQVAHRMYPPLGSTSVVRESIPVPGDAGRDAERLVRTMGLEGYSEVEFRRDRAGQAVLMEVNPRLSASVEVAVRAGVDFPVLLYKWAAGERLNEVPGYRTGVRMRWLGGDLAYLKAAFCGQGRPDVPPVGQAIASFGLDFFRPSGYDYFDLRDPRPALAASWSMIRQVVRQVTRQTNGSAGECH